jgi:2-polyprenyl-3-methyl-5-hydroxy-6-metoxy-1,4-benzoquinol methylase
MTSQADSVKCTICGSHDVKELITLSGDVRIMLCDHCQNAFTFPKPVIPDYSTEDFQAREGDTNKLTLLSDLPTEIQTSYTVQLSMIEKKLPKGAPVLEIGGGEGIFLDLVKKAGYDVELIEPSYTASQRAKKRGLDVHNDYFDNRTFDRKYALVCMGHVLEHIDDPLSTIKKIKNVLSPGGFILLTQTNVNGFMPRFQKKHWYAWVPDQHFTHFSLAGLKYLASQSDLVVSDYKYSRLVHGPSIYHKTLKYIPFLQDQIHILLQMT